LNSSHQSTSTTSQATSTQQSSTTQRSLSSPMIIIDSVDDREIIMKSRSHTPIITPDITSPTRQQSRRSTESPERTPIAEPAQSQHSTPIVRRISSDDRGPLNNIEDMLIKQGKQIRALYGLQKTSLERILFLQTQVKKLSSDKKNDLNPKILSVSNNFGCIILLSHLDI